MDIIKIKKLCAYVKIRTQFFIKLLFEQSEKSDLTSLLFTLTFYLFTVLFSVIE